MAEKEYIERDRVVGKLIERKYCSTSSKIDYGEVIRLLNSEPAADAQEVVRCKDCSYFCKATVNKKGFIICPASGMDITNNDFCSYGAKMDKE